MYGGLSGKVVKWALEASECIRMKSDSGAVVLMWADGHSQFKLKVLLKPEHSLTPTSFSLSPPVQHKIFSAPCTSALILATMTIGDSMRWHHLTPVSGTRLCPMTPVLIAA